MIKKNLKILIITSIITLLPILAGLILWNQLPEQMPTHWNAAGEIDGWSSKPFAVFVLPLILLGAQWLCVIATSADPKKAAHPEKVLHMIFWFIPVLSVVMHSLTYAAALGKEVKMEAVLPVILGLLFTIIGSEVFDWIPIDKIVLIVICFIPVGVVWYLVKKFYLPKRKAKKEQGKA